MSYYWLHCLDNKYNITSISVSRQVEANGSGFAIYFHWILHKSSCRKQCHLEERSHQFLSHFMWSFCLILYIHLRKVCTNQFSYQSLSGEDLYWNVWYFPKLFSKIRFYGSNIKSRTELCVQKLNIKLRIKR